MDGVMVGDEVIVSTTGTVRELLGLSGFMMRTPSGDLSEVWGTPDTSVTVLRPERLSRREVIEAHAVDELKSKRLRSPWRSSLRCGCSEWFVSDTEGGAARLHRHHLEAKLAKAGY